MASFLLSVGVKAIETYVDQFVVYSKSSVLNFVYVIVQKTIFFCWNPVSLLEICHKMQTVLTVLISWSIFSSSIFTTFTIENARIVLVIVESKLIYLPLL